MLCTQRYFTERLLLLAVTITLFASLAACATWRTKRDINVTAKTTVSGIVNGSPIEVEVLATFNTGRGGSSTCRFTKLPTGFNPGSLGTHA
jgi:hypothetical protein